jgi:hypothetical protein
MDFRQHLIAALAREYLDEGVDRRSRLRLTVKAIENASWSRKKR